MRRSRRWLPPLLGACLALTISAGGCDWVGITGDAVKPNRGPSVRITNGAVEGADTDYRVEFFWFGSDPDGTIAFFLYAIDDTCLCSWELEEGVVLPGGETDVRTTVVKSMDPDSCRARGLEPAYDHPDSIWKRIETFSGRFLFQATTPHSGGSSPTSADWHTFYVKAVDDRGAVSRADHRYFNAVTIAPTVFLTSPVGHGSTRSQLVSRFVGWRWEGWDLDAVRFDLRPVGYQIKLVKIESLFESDDRIIRRFVGAADTMRNLFIPDSVVVPDKEDLTERTYHATDWWPKRGDPYLHRFFARDGLETGAHAFAVRAIDIAGATTPSSAFLISDDVNEGNVVKLDVNTALPLRPNIFLDEKELLGRHVFRSAGEVWRVEVPTNLPLRFTWRLDTTHYATRPGRSNYALDIPDPGCEACIEPDGIGGWIGWGDYRSTVTPIVFGPENAGEQHVLTIRARDEGFAPDREAIATIVMDVFDFSLERPALLVDDFTAPSVRDCEHDAVLRRLVGNAIQPYLAPDDALGLFDARPPHDQCVESLEFALPSLSSLASFRTIYWNVAPLARGTTLGRLSVPGDSLLASRTLRVYLENGGNLMVWGRSSIGALLGDFYPEAPYVGGDEVGANNANFGPGSYVWDLLKFRTRMDRVGRPRAGRNILSKCSGLIGLEATAEALAAGFPAGIPDPTGYDPTRTAIWFDNYTGADNPTGEFSVTGFTGSPPVQVAGLDTLYTYVSNSWTYAHRGASGIREACGTAFLSPFESNPIVVRYRDPVRFSGRIVWMGTPIFRFENQGSDVQRLFDGLARWLHTGDD